MRRRPIRALVIAVALAWSFAALAHVAPASAREAVPLDEYRADVAEARLLVEGATSRALSKREAVDLAAEVSTRVPLRVRVDTPDGVRTADNTIVRTLAARLDAADTDEERGERATELLTHLTSLESALGVPTDRVVPHDEAVLAGILGERPADVRNPITEFIGDLIDRLGRALAEWWGSPRTSTFSTAVSWITRVILVLGLALLLVVVGRRLWAAIGAGLARRGRGGGPEEAPVSDAVVEAARDLPDDPLAYADERADAGEMREAVRALFGGAARTLQERGYVVEARTRTNRELLVEVRPRSERVFEPLERLSRVFEAAWYGHREPDARGYSAARGLYVAVVDAAAPVLAEEAS